MIASVPSGETPQLVMRTRRVCSWTPEAPSMDGQCPTWTPGVGQCPMDALALAFRTGTFFRAQNSKVSWWKANWTLSSDMSLVAAHVASHSGRGPQK